MKILRNAVFASIAATSAASAGPLDDQNTIYVDGLPCGSFCQSYLGLSGQYRRIEQTQKQAPARSTFLHRERPAKPSADNTKRVARKLATQTAIPIPIPRMPESKRSLPLAASKSATPRAREMRPEPAAAEMNAAVAPDRIAPPNGSASLPSMTVGKASPSAVVDRTPATQKDQDSPTDDPGRATGMPSAGDKAAESGSPKQPLADLTSETPATSEAKSSVETSDTEPKQNSPGTTSMAPVASPTTETVDRQNQAAAVPSSPDVMPKIEAPASSAVSGSAGADPVDPGQSASEGAGPHRDTTSSGRQDQVAAISTSHGPLPSNAENPAPSAVERRVAIIMVRPEIASIAELASKDIAIDARQVPSRDVVRTALATAGANGANLSDGGKALDRLLGGEVSAAVLAVLSASAAENFPNIAGFRLFRIPLAAN